MALTRIFKAVVELFHRSATASNAARQLTLVELSELAARDAAEFERLLTAAGVPTSPSERYSPAARRKWSELRGFDRTTFNHEAYLASLRDGLQWSENSPPPWPSASTNAH